MSDAPNPRAIHQEVLDRTGQAYFEDDFDTFAQYFLLPQDVATFDGTRHLKDRSDLEDLFRSMRAFMLAKGGTRLERWNVAAEFDDPETLRAIHESRLMNAYEVIGNGHAAFSILRFSEGRWQVAYSQYIVEQDHAAALGTYHPDLAAQQGDTQ